MVFIFAQALPLELMDLIIIALFRDSLSVIQTIDNLSSFTK